MKHSIKNKFIVSYIVIFSISVFAFTSYMKSAVNKNCENIVEREMQELMLNSREHLKQYFIINNIEPENNIFLNYGDKIADEMSLINSCMVELYTNDGRYICSSMLENKETIVLNGEDEKEKRDVDLAIANKAGASIMKNNDNDKVYVSFSFPLYINHKNCGIVRFTKDYTDC